VEDEKLQRTVIFGNEDNEVQTQDGLHASSNAEAIAEAIRGELGVESGRV